MPPKILALCAPVTSGKFPVNPIIVRYASQANAVASTN